MENSKSSQTNHFTNDTITQLPKSIISQFAYSLEELVYQTQILRQSSSRYMDQCVHAFHLNNVNDLMLWHTPVNLNSVLERSKDLQNSAFSIFQQYILLKKSYTHFCLQNQDVAGFDLFQAECDPDIITIKFTEPLSEAIHLLCAWQYPTQSNALPDYIVLIEYFDSTH
ncbi:hypothetical protein MJO28_004275 [Puccinia striiformis f. sp. tritici]|uniref:Uncharacterized protein n=1 Tax=Puccinia striiformis f. sp. tritici TaxID=168172 RepID=A0ACC0EP01_9BASI|nr:hypothetical protein MJO28_004275 [Puccinia striiformis f. sp. tritici]